MTFTQATLKSDAQQQLALWNESGGHVLNTPYTPPAGMPWCVMGCVMADAFDPALHEAEFIAGVVALDAVTSVENPRPLGDTPDTILINPEAPEDPTHEAVLHVTSALSCLVGNGIGFQEKQHKTVKPPLDKNWVVLNIRLSAPIALDNATAIAALENGIKAIEISGQQAATICKHLIGGEIPLSAQNISFNVGSRIRLDRIPVEEP